MVALVLLLIMFALFGISRGQHGGARDSLARNPGDGDAVQQQSREKQWEFHLLAS